METRGSRLRKYLVGKTGGRRGWVNKLAADSGVKRQSLSAAMGDRVAPDLKTIDALAEALGVRPFEILAAMDGDAAVSVLDPAAREALRQEIEAALDARLGPRRAGSGQGTAA